VSGEARIRGMDKGQKTKWFLIGLLTGLITSIIAGNIAYTYLASINGKSEINKASASGSGIKKDPFQGTRPDIGRRLHEFGRPALWSASHMPLGESKFIAAAGPSRYMDEDNDDWDYYTIDVEKESGKSSYVFFQRDFKINEIPPGLISEKVESIVTFNEKSRLVTFAIGEKTYKYKLPSR